MLAVRANIGVSSVIDRGVSDPIIPSADSGSGV
jgi:hypothetical protein